MCDSQPDKGERVFYIRDENGQPMACLAYAPMNLENSKVRYAMSVLHPNDKFDRKLARKIALGRLRVNWDMVDAPDGKPLTAALKAIMENTMVPKRIRRRIAAWPKQNS